MIAVKLSMKIKKIIVLLFLIRVAANAEFFIQLKASEIKDESLAVVDSLKRIGVPALLTEGIVKTKKYYRVRVGGFKSKDDASLYAGFLDIKSPYIIKDENIEQSISMFIDTICTGSQVYEDVEVLIDAEKFVITTYYSSCVSFENYYPQFLNVYNFLSMEKKVIEYVTGFNFAGEFIDLGIKHSVFENPEGIPTGNNFDKEITDFSQKNGISVDRIKNSIFTYGDILPYGSVTLLYSLNIKDLSLLCKNDIGFDYVDKNGKKYLNTDALNNAKWGREGLVRLLIDEKENYKQDNFIVNIRKIESPEFHVRLCLLYINN